MLLPSLGRERLIHDYRVSRPRLLKLVAPAGYGKTTVAREICRTTRSSGVVDCLRADTPVELYRAFIVACVGASEPDALQRMGEAFIGLGPDETAWLAYLDQTIQRFSAPDVVTFENAEAIAGFDRVGNAIERSLLLVPESTRLIVCARVDPPQGFSRFSPPPQTLRFGIDDLRFDRNEVASLFEHVGANSRLIDQIFEFTLGWPMLAMMMFMLAKRGRLPASISERTLGETDVYNYLLAEVFESLDPSGRDILELAARVPGLTISDLHVLLGTVAENALLAIRDATPFISVDENNGISIHPAVAETLRASSSRGIVQRNALVDALSAEFPLRAALIAANAKEYDRAAELLQEARYWLRSPSPEVIEILYLLPLESLIRYPAVWNAASYVRAFSRHSSEWLADAERVIRFFDNDTPDDIRVELFAGFMNVYVQRGEFSRAHALLEEFATTSAGQSPMGAITIKLWEAIADIYLGGYADRDWWERELGSLLGAVKWLRILIDTEAFGRTARLAGDRVAERAILERSCDEAAALGDHVLKYLTLVEALFGAWLSGEDDLYRRYFKMLGEAIHPTTERAATLLRAACRGEFPLSLPDTEQIKVRSYAYLIASANAQGALRLEYAVEAMVAADRSQQPLPMICSRIAIAIVDSSQADVLLIAAAEIASHTWSSSLQSAVLAVRNGSLDGHFLAPLARRFQSVPENVQKPKNLLVEILTGIIRFDGAEIRLSAREFEFLSFLATRAAPTSRESIAASIWPDLDENRGVGAVKVTLSRLRSKLGDPGLIVSTPAGYVLNGHVEIDILNLLEQRAVDSQDYSQFAQLSAASERLMRWSWTGPLLKQIEQKVRG